MDLRAEFRDGSFGWDGLKYKKKKHRVLMTVETWLPGAEVNYVSIGGDEIRA